MIEPMMSRAVSFDNRVVDGSTAVQFLVRLKQLVEDPEALLPRCHRSAPDSLDEVGRR